MRPGTIGVELVMTNRPLRIHHHVAWPLLAAIAGCGQILGLGSFENECGGDLDAPCTPGAGGAGSTSTSTDTSAGGASGLCAPGMMRVCYDGPEGTKHTGICKDGMQTCGNNGLWGPCDGEQLPKPQEDCSNSLDDDCNGMVNDHCMCMPGMMKVCYGSDPSTQDVGECKSGMETCLPSGDGYGDCVGEIDPKAEDYTAKGDENCDGIPSADTAWVDTFSATGQNDPSVTIASVATDPTGNVYVGGWFNGVNLTVGTTVLPGEDNGPTYAIVAKLGPDGTPIWAKSYTGGYQSQVERVAYDAVNNHVVIAGEATGGSIDLGAPTGVVAAGTFLAALDTNGNTLWADGCSDFSVGGLKVDSAGNIDVGGSSQGAAATTCGTKSFTPNANAASNVVLIQATADGTPNWVHGVTGAGMVVRVNDIAIAPDDSIWFGGSMSGTSDFYGGSQVHGGAAIVGEFMIGHTEADGTADLAFGINDGRPYSMLLDLDCTGVSSIAVDAQSTVYVVASLCGTMDFGGTQLTGSDEVITAALDFTSQWLWAESFGDAQGASAPAGLILQPSGDLVISGRTSNRADFGLGVFLTGNAQYGFLARLNAAGPTTPAVPVWNDFYGGDKMSSGAFVEVIAMATSPRAQPNALDVVLVGTYTQPADFGTGSQPQTGSHSAFVMKVAP
jgi:hypothetical protein